MSMFSHILGKYRATKPEVPDNSVEQVNIDSNANLLVAQTGTWNVTVGSSVLPTGAATSGTVLWASGSMGALTTPFCIDLYDIPFFTGLTLVIAAANSTVTVAYE